MKEKPLYQTVLYNYLLSSAIIYLITNELKNLDFTIYYYTILNVTQKTYFCKVKNNGTTKSIKYTFS